MSAAIHKSLLCSHSQITIRRSLQDLWWSNGQKPVKHRFKTLLFQLKIKWYSVTPNAEVDMIELWNIIRPLIRSEKRSVDATRYNDTTVIKIACAPDIPLKCIIDRQYEDSEKKRWEHEYHRYQLSHKNSLNKKACCCQKILLLTEKS